MKRIRKSKAVGLMTIGFLLAPGVVPAWADQPTATSYAVGETGYAPRSAVRDTDYAPSNLLIGWPRQVTSGPVTATVYQPQFDSWENDHLIGRAAVSIQTASSATPIYGFLTLTAHTDVDNTAGQVTLKDIQVNKVSLPKTLPGGADYVALVKQNIPLFGQSVPLAQLQANLAIGQAQSRHREEPVRNTPPRIIYSAKPAVLVPIDGQPVLRKVQGTDLLRIINTPATLVMDQNTGNYYLYVADRWMQASSLKGSWTQAVNPPASLETIKRMADAQNADPAEANSEVTTAQDAGAKTAPDSEVAPTVYVSTTPTELLTTQGPANFVPISGTKLLWAQNSGNSIFMNTADQQVYTVISGRWYRSASLTEGAWSYVPRTQLPSDFAHIPDSNPAGEALASVPNTEEAQQARIAQSIPQTATVNRAEAHLNVTYDGDPKFQSIEGTSMQYAVNTHTPVVEVNPSAYYACQNGVWFTSTEATGPWNVATSVPSVIYTIPVSCPINYVTNAYVYGSSPQEVYVGYTPGYLGTYIEPDGCVVYGSGYAYNPWIGNVWCGWPATYGFGAAFDFGGGWGFGLGFGFGWGPWWGPWGGWHGDWRGGWHGDHNGWRGDHGGWHGGHGEHGGWGGEHGGWGGHGSNFNAYNNWGHNSVAGHGAPYGHGGFGHGAPYGNSALGHGAPYSGMAHNGFGGQSRPSGFSGYRVGPGSGGFRSGGNFGGSAFHGGNFSGGGFRGGGGNFNGGFRSGSLGGGSHVGGFSGGGFRGGNFGGGGFHGGSFGGGGGFHGGGGGGHR